MKVKTYYLGSILFTLVGILLLASCETTTTKEDDKQGEEDQDRKPPKRPKETISLRRAHEMYKAYQERHEVLTKLKDGEEEARYGWHSIDFYKNYIAYLEKESRKVGIRISGLRMYYVAYPENDDKSGKYAGYQTYFYVPTYFNKKEKRHIAFDPLHIDENGNPLPIHEIIVNGKRVNTNEASIAQSLTKTASTTDISSIANMAEMCEPNCDY